MGMLGDLAKRLHNKMIQKAPYEVLCAQRRDEAARRDEAIRQYLVAVGHADYAAMERARRDVEGHQESLAVIDNRLDRDFEDTVLADADKTTKWVTAERRCSRCGRTYLGMVQKCVICQSELPPNPAASDVSDEPEQARKRRSTRRRTRAVRDELEEIGGALGDAKLGKAMGRALEGMTGACPSCGGPVWVKADECGHCGHPLAR